MFGLKSANSKAVKNSNLAISWLGATFPELTRKEAHAENATVLRAQAYALFDASISLQVLFLLGVLVFLSIASWSISGGSMHVDLLGWMRTILDNGKLISCAITS